MTYNTTSFDNVTNLLDLWQQTSYQTDYVMNILLLFGLWFCLFVYMKRYDTKAVYFASSLITTIVALLLFWAQLITSTVFGICIVMLFASIIVERWRDE